MAEGGDFHDEMTLVEFVEHKKMVAQKFLNDSGKDTHDAAYWTASVNAYRNVLNHLEKLGEY